MIRAILYAAAFHVTPYFGVGKRLKHKSDLKEKLF